MNNLQQVFYKFCNKNKEVLKCAVNVIHFNDGSDYLRTLYQIVSILTDDEETITDEKINKLFNKLNDE